MNSSNQPLVVLLTPGATRSWLEWDIKYTPHLTWSGNFSCSWIQARAASSGGMSDWCPSWSGSLKPRISWELWHCLRKKQESSQPYISDQDQAECRCHVYHDQGCQRSLEQRRFEGRRKSNLAYLLLGESSESNPQYVKSCGLTFWACAIGIGAPPGAHIPHILVGVIVVPPARNNTTCWWCYPHPGWCLPNSVKGVKVKAEMARPAGDDDALLWALGGRGQAADDEHQEKMSHPFLH